MKACWRDLASELDAWAETGRLATFWWRDDDAVEPTAALDRLLALAEETGTPIAVAVIPANATRTLATYLRDWALATPLQHGWRHANYAPDGSKAAELGLHRPAATTCDDLARGRERLAELLGEPPVPCLVPPWNRIAPEITLRLPELGFTGLSAFGPRPRGDRGVVARANCHVDPIEWRRTRGFGGEDRALEQVVRHLRARRSGSADPDEPTGHLTHHLAMDEQCWEFTERLLLRTNTHPAARWLDVRDALSSDQRALPSDLRAG